MRARKRLQPPATYGVAVAVRFLYMVFTVWRQFPSGPTLFSVALSQKGGAEFCQLSLLDIKWFLSFTVIASQLKPFLFYVTLVLKFQDKCFIRVDNIAFYYLRQDLQCHKLASSSLCGWG